MDVAWTRTLTVGGLPGTGTTTACRTLSDRSGLRHVYAGQMFRDQAARSGMSLEEYGAHAEEHPEVDLELDRRQAEVLRGAPVILEGRLSGFLAYRDRRPAVKVWFTCDAYERARRLVERDGGEVEARLAEMRRREASERKRFLEFYGFDTNDLALYDLVLDTTRLTKQQIVESIEADYVRRLAPRRWWKLGFR